MIEKVHGDQVIKGIDSIDRFVFRSAKVYINGLLHVCEDVTMKEDNTTVVFSKRLRFLVTFYMFAKISCNDF